MSIDTKALLKGHISAEEILHIIQTVYDKDAVLVRRNMEDFGKNCHEGYIFVDPKGRWYTERAFVSFQSSQHYTRNMFVFFSSMLSAEEREICGSRFDEIAETGVTYVSLSVDGKGFANEVIYKLSKYFGGWYCEDDATDEYEYVPKENPSEKEASDLKRTRTLSALNDIEATVKSLKEQYPDVDLTFADVVSFGPFGSPFPSPENILEWVRDARSCIAKSDE